jgi:uncharacterized protein (TIGR00255 family)
MVFEDRIKDLLQKRLKRGKANLNLIYDGAISRDEKITINKRVAKNYYAQLAGLERYLGLANGITTKEIAALPGVLTYEVRERSLLTLWPRIKAALDKALDRLIAEREREGRSIYRDIAKRGIRIKRMIAFIASRAHLNIEEYRKRFAERVRDLSGGREIDMGRLEMEVAIYAKNSDITEEITRLKNHISNLERTIAGNGEVGKKLDFIAQELHREINTIGSKVGDFKISKNVIEIKSEIEKIREQAKNVE